ncbi:reprolysin-like metallopeptidase [Bizionia sp. KMM 8389]
MKKQLHKVLPFVMLLFCVSAFSQNSHFTKVTNGGKLNSVSIHQTYAFDLNTLMTDLATAQERGAANASTSGNLTMKFPNLDGELESFIIQEASVMAPELQAQYPNIRSYVGYGIDTPDAYLRFSISPYKGMSGIVLSGTEGKTYILEPNTANLSEVIIRKKNNLSQKDQHFECTTPDTLREEIENAADFNRSADGTLHTFDLAMSVTAEYSAFHGGTLPLVNAAIVATMTNVNAIFETDFNVNMVLVATNDNVIYLNPATDPYSGTSDAAYNSTLQSTLDANIGSLNYDIGHLMAGIGNNGNAGCIGCVCVSGSKGSGYTTSTVPSGENFDIDYVAHEMGHQFGANHTFTFRSESTIAQMEPGSGTTIMSYAGITGATDVQSNADPYFHAVSIQQVTTHVSTRNCDIETETGNSVPVADAGLDMTIPKGTPYRLTGSATDPDASDALTYCWEQFDTNNAANAYPDPTSTNSNEPLVRSYLPTTNPVRTVPPMADLLADGLNANPWEQVPTVGRSADFRLTVRDNKPGGAANDFDNMRVVWSSNAGPFVVTSQNTDQLVWSPGDTETITWDVAGTDSNGINAATVNILLSTSLTPDANFTTVLASNVPNNGSYQVVVPSVNSAYSRIMVEASNGTFFNINDNYFAIGNYVYVPGGESCQDYAFNAGIQLEENATSFNGYTLDIDDSATISSITVSVDATTNNTDQIYTAIRGPWETDGFHRLAYGPCAGSSGYVFTFDDDGTAVDCGNTNGNDNVTPVDPLSFAAGENSQGGWIFYIGDVVVDGNLATWNSTTITVCTAGGFVPQLSVPEFGLESTFSVYPNPNNGEFSVKFTPDSNEPISVEVFDIRGRKVYNNAYTNTGDFNESISLNNAESGMYILTVSQGAKKVSKKVIVN